MPKYFVSYQARDPWGSERTFSRSVSWGNPISNMSDVHGIEKKILDEHNDAEDFVMISMRVINWKRFEEE